MELYPPPIRGDHNLYWQINKQEHTPPNSKKTHSLSEKGTKILHRDVILNETDIISKESGDSYKHPYVINLANICLVV